MNTLSPDEREILGTLELNGDLSASEIAAAIGKRPHTVQYLLGKLREAGAFKLTTNIDLHRLDRRYCGVFLSLASAPKSRLALIKLAAAEQQIGWVAEFAGQYDLGLALAVRTPVEADALLAKLLGKSKVEIVAKAVTFRLKLVDCPRGYLRKAAGTSSPVELVDNVPLGAIDLLDHKILSALDRNPELSHRASAQTLGIPHTTLELRIKKLRTQGILLNKIATPNLKLLKRELYKLLIFSRTRTEQLSNQLRLWASKHPLIPHYVEALGAWDYELNVEAESALELASTIQELHSNFGQQLQQVVALTMTQCHKFTRYPYAHSE